MVSREFTTAKNVEARVAAHFVQTASMFMSRMMIRRGTMEVNCKSIMGVVSMSISEGDKVIITTTGKDEQEAADALVKMLSEAK